MAFNVISPNKKLSQLIAQSWLDGQRLNINKDWLIEQGFISQKEAPYYDDEKIKVEPNPEPNPEPNQPLYIGLITFTEEGELGMYIPYPDRPDECLPDEKPLTDEVLRKWVESPEDSKPWLPEHRYIPYTC